MPNSTAIYIYVTVSIIAITILAGFLIKCKNDSCSPYSSISHPSKGNSHDPKHERNLCLCSSGGTNLCANRDELKASYLKGNTEYQDFGKLQKELGGPYWHNSNFNNY